MELALRHIPCQPRLRKARRVPRYLHPTVLPQRGRIPPIILVRTNGEAEARIATEGQNWGM